MQESTLGILSQFKVLVRAVRQAAGIAAGHRIGTAGCGHGAAGCRLVAAGCRIGAAGCRLGVAGAIFASPWRSGWCGLVGCSAYYSVKHQWVILSMKRLR